MTETEARHTIAAYNAMLEDSVEEEGVGRVWRGSLTKLVDSIGASRTYYALIWKALEDGGHVSRAMHGAGRSGSAMILHYPPEIASLLLTDDTRSASLPLADRLTAQEKLLGGIDVQAALIALNEKIDAVAAQINHKHDN